MNSWKPLSFSLECRARWAGSVNGVTNEMQRALVQSLNLEDVINAKFPEERNCRKVSHELGFLKQALEFIQQKIFIVILGI